MALLPEIIFDILLRLPVKPLLRFRSLSKLICCTIDDSDFIKAHLNRSIETNTHKKLILYGHAPAFAQLYALDFDDGLKRPVELDDPLKYNHGWLGYNISGSCSGLLLLLGETKLNTLKLVLWNPFTKRYKILTDPPVSIIWSSNYRRCDSFGLGYDETSNDYRVVRILQVMPRETWIYSLRSNSWRKLDVWCELSEGDMGIFVNGVLYFHGKNLETIVAFDIATEAFCTIPLPYILEGFRLTRGLCFLEEKLCCCDYGEKGVDIYVGDKHEDEVTWSNPTMITFEHNFLETPVFYSEEGAKILHIERNNEIVWYDFNNMETPERIPTVPDIKKHYQVISFDHSSTICWESLVSLVDDGIPVD